MNDHKKMKLLIPKSLLYSRLLFAVMIFVLGSLKGNDSKIYALCLMYAGILSDIFDGIIARRLNISTSGFRVLDTVFDLLFYCSIFTFIARVKHGSIIENLPCISIILGLEVLMYAISLLRFAKLPSPHAILSKFWGLYLVVEFSLLILGVQGNHFTLALLFGIFVHIDRVLIYVLLKQWEHDIPSSYHALLLRNGKSISKNKLFND